MFFSFRTIFYINLQNITNLESICYVDLWYRAITSTYSIVQVLLIACYQKDQNDKYR